MSFGKSRLYGLFISASAVVGGAIVGAIAPASAATFTVEYEGLLQQRESVSVPRFGAGPEDIFRNVTTFSDPLPLFGSYTFDDETSQVSSAQFQAFSQDGSVFLSDTFAPVPLLNAIPRTETSSSADFSSATYLSRSLTTASAETSQLSVDTSAFSFVTSRQAFSDPSSTQTNSGIISSFTVLAEPDEPDMPNPDGDPTSVPEPASVLGLVLVGLLSGAKLRRQS